MASPLHIQNARFFHRVAVLSVWAKILSNSHWQTHEFVALTWLTGNRFRVSSLSKSSNPMHNRCLVHVGTPVRRNTLLIKSV